MMSSADFLLSEYGRASSTPSPVNTMMASFAADFRPDKDINLGVGYVNEKTIPRRLILRAMQAVVSRPDTYRLALNYGGPQGSVNLISSLKKFHVENSLGGLTADILDRHQMIIGPNGATSLLEGIAHVLKPGIVITPDPMYYIYCNYLERMGFEVLTVPEDSDGICPQLVRERLHRLGARKRQISFFYIVTVNNPTGNILSNRRREEMVAIAEHLSHDLGRTIPLVFDKAYEDLIHDRSVEPPCSGLLFDRHGLVYEIGTVSKILSPALRIGYMIGRDGPFMQAMIQKTSDVGFSAPLITQEITSYMLDHHVMKQIEKVNRQYRIKARAVRRWIDAQLGTVLESCSGGRAGFYFYLTFSSVRTTENSAFFRYLARTTGSAAIDGPAADRYPRVIYVPGEFCVHPRGDLVAKGARQLRISYGFEELPRIREAVTFMKHAAEYASRFSSC